MDLIILLEQIINGLILGSMYALVAAGLALIYGGMRIMNFAHAEFFMIGGYTTVFLLTAGLSPWLAVPAAGLVAGVGGLIVYRVILAPLATREGGLFSVIAATLGISIVVQNSALKLFGEQFQAAPYFSDVVLQFGEVFLPMQRILIFVVSLGTLGLAWAFLRFTPIGRAIKATAQDAEAATVVGVPVTLIRTVTFAVGTFMAGLAAAMLSPIFAVNPWMGVPVILKAFVVVVLGGLGSFVGAIVGGLALGVVEALGVAFTSSEWQSAISYAILIVVVWFRPWGLFGVAER